MGEMSTLNGLSLQCVTNGREAVKQLTKTFIGTCNYWTTAASGNIQSRRNGQSEKMFCFNKFYICQMQQGPYSDQLHAGHKLMTWHMITGPESIKKRTNK